MKNDRCAYENSVVVASRTGDWQDSLIAHANECDVCKEVKEVSRWMGSLVRQFESQPLPNPDLVWLRTLIREEQGRQDRALRPLAVAQGILALVLAGWLALNLSEVKAVFDQPGSLPSYSAGIVLIAVLAFLIVYPALVEE